MRARTPSWLALPDALEIARQWRPGDVRGLPATLRYGASVAGVTLAVARGRPGAVVLHDDRGAVLGSELESAIDSLAAELAAQVRGRGVTEVVVCCGSARELVSSVAAAGALGLDVLLVSPALGTAAATGLLSTADVVVADSATREQVRPMVGVEPVDASAVSRRSPGRSLRSVPRPRELGSLQLLTSGTTGDPKRTVRGGAGVNQVATVLSLMRALDLHRDEPVLIAPSLSHGHGLSVLTAAMVIGAPAVLAHGRDGVELLALARKQRAAVLALVPAQLAAVLDALDAEGPVLLGPLDDPTEVPGLPWVHRVATGSAPMPSGLLERALARLGDRVVDFYGSSAVGTVTVATPQDLREAPGTVGRPAAGVRITIGDDQGRELGVDEVGHVLVESPFRAASVEAGPVAVGDLGRLDADGRLFLHGRADDVVIVGGHNVSLSHVRGWFAQQPEVQGVEVVVLEHPTLGHELEVRVRGDADLLELAGRARRELGSATAPRRVVGATDPG